MDFLLFGFWRINNYFTARKIYAVRRTITYIWMLSSWEQSKLKCSTRNRGSPQSQSKPRPESSSCQSLHWLRECSQPLGMSGGTASGTPAAADCVARNIHCETKHPLSLERLSFGEGVRGNWVMKSEKQSAQTLGKHASFGHYNCVFVHLICFIYFAPSPWPQIDS